MKVETGSAPAAGTTLYYEVAGEDTPVVLMHPGQGGLVLWDRQFEEFARSHRVVRYDARGFGRSERPDMAFAHWEDLRAVLDALGIERAGLVGLSGGGRTALDFALAYPARVAGMVLVNPGISGYKWVALDKYFADIQDATARDDVGAFVEVQLRMWVDGPERAPDKVDRSVRDEVARVLTEQALRNRARGNNPRVDELNAIDRLGEIRTPTLIVESALDQPDAHAICDTLAKEIPGARRVVIQDAAHLVNLERPREFAAAVLPFLASLSY